MAWTAASQARWADGNENGGGRVRYAHCGQGVTGTPEWIGGAQARGLGVVYCPPMHDGVGCRSVALLCVLDPAALAASYDAS